MPRFFIKGKQIKEKTIEILDEDVKHIKNVLRKKVGDQLEICNQENGKNYKCQIARFSEESIIAEILEEIEVVESRIKVDIYQGLPKADKMELIIQKSVELGANAIIPVAMKRCVVKIASKDENKKMERWQKIAESAAKQSGRNIIPEIKKIATIQEIINQKQEYDTIIVAYENEKEYTLKQELIKLKENSNKELKIAIVVGPEGGLEEEDVKKLKENNVKIVTLGNRILRTETVALNMLSIIMYELES